MYLIGYVLKPQGIKGEIKINPISPELARYKRLDNIYISLEDVRQNYSVQQVRISNKFVYLKLLGIENRNDAALLNGAEVLIKASDLIKPAENEFFIHDLIGCQVISVEGKFLGILKDVLQFSSNDVYVVDRKSGEEILIPAIKDVIKEVDINAQLITIHILEGLLD
jgi:16S rRNA processing protein RimM